MEAVRGLAESTRAMAPGVLATLRSPFTRREMKGRLGSKIDTSCSFMVLLNFLARILFKV